MAFAKLGTTPRRRRLSVWVAAGLVLGAACVQAAEEAQRPRIGLVLGGGGARGAAHIGVLEVLDQLRVPVDCLAGTSIGALVTGAFAAGLSPAEMRETMANADWPVMFRDDPAFSELSYRNKRLLQQYLPGSEFGVTENGLQYQPGVISGQKIKSFFNQLVGADRGEILIQDLPLPVSLIGTDIATGGRVVMREGSLTQAMRASMSLPGLMTPVDRDGHKLVDGGLVDNLPIGEVRQRCQADVVIAVNVGSPLLPADEIGSLISVSAQMVNILTNQNVQLSLATLKPTDVYIKPDLSGISTSDFSRSSETADRGHAAALAMADQLKRLSVSEEQYATWHRRVDLAARQSPRVDAIEVAELKRVSPVAVERLITQPIGQPLDAGQLNTDLLRVYGEGYYQGVDYTVTSVRDRNLLRVTPVEKSWGPNYLRFGLGIASDRYQNTYSLRAAYQRTWIDALGAELLIAAEVGTNKEIGIGYYQPLDAGQRFFIEPRVFFGRRDVVLFEDNEQRAKVQYTDSGADLALGLRIQQFGQARAGWRYARKRSSTVIGLNQLPEFDVRYGGAYASIDLDQLDRVYNPRNGLALYARYFDANSERYAKLDTTARGAYQLADQWVVQGRAGYQGSTRGELPVYDLAQLGGFLRMSAFSDGQLSGDEATYAGLRIERILADLPLGLRGDIRLGFAAEAGRVKRPFTETNLTGWQDSFGLYIGGETPIGPVFFGGAYSPSSGYWNVHFNVGIN